MMNNQEVIEILKTLCHTCKLFPRCAYEKPECFKAINMAISALQAQDLQPTCNNLATDTISRTAAIDAVEHITSSMSVCVTTDEQALADDSGSYDSLIPCEDTTVCATADTTDRQVAGKLKPCPFCGNEPTISCFKGKDG